MAEWVKVFPSAANKIFVSQVDADSPTGFGLVEKSVSEMKTVLGLPISTYIGKITFAYVVNVDGSSLSEIYNDFSVDGVLTAIGTGAYSFVLTGTNALSKGFASYQIENNSLLDSLPSGYTLEIDETAHGWNFQFKDSGVAADLPSLDFVYFKFKIEKWIT